jgi:NitT/TauT family transport system permease protein
MSNTDMLDTAAMLDDATGTLAERPADPREPDVRRAAQSPRPPIPRLLDWIVKRRAMFRRIFLGAISIALFIYAWHYLTENRVSFHVRFTNVPSPRMVLEKAREAAHSTQFAQNVLYSCQRIFIGFTLAGLVATPLGLLMGRYELIRTMIAPITEMIRPIPAIAWVPMSIMLWPTNEESIVFITFLGSFFPILLNTLHGMANVDPILVRAARSLGAKEADIFREVYLPSALPQIFTGFTIGVGVAWVSLIAAEMISGQFGIGYFTWEAYSLVQYADIALGMISIGLLGLLSSVAVRLVGHLCMPWRR